MTWTTLLRTPIDRFEFYIDGQPIHKERPRAYAMGKTICMYNSQTKIEKKIKGCLENQINNLLHYKIRPDVTYQVDFVFAMPIPPAWSKERFNMCQWQESHDRKPDVDNMIKFYLDVCNGLLWKDDSEVTHITARKCHDSRPHTRMQVTVMPRSSAIEKNYEVLKHFSPREFMNLVRELGYIQGLLFSMDCQGVKEFGENCELSDYEIEELSKSLCTFGRHYGDRLKQIGDYASSRSQV